MVNEYLRGLLALGKFSTTRQASLLCIMALCTVDGPQGFSVPSHLSPHSIQADLGWLISLYWSSLSSQGSAHNIFWYYDTKVTRPSKPDPLSPRIIYGNRPFSPIMFLVDTQATWTVAPESRTPGLSQVKQYFTKGVSLGDNKPTYILIWF